MNKKTSSAWKRLIDSPSEIVASIGVIILSAFGFTGKVEGAWLVSGLVALLYLWVGIRVSKLGPQGIEIEDDSDGQSH